MPPFTALDLANMARFRAPLHSEGEVEVDAKGYKLSQQLKFRFQ